MILYKILLYNYSELFSLGDNRFLKWMPTVYFTTPAVSHMYVQCIEIYESQMYVQCIEIYESHMYAQEIYESDISGKRYFASVGALKASNSYYACLQNLLSFFLRHSVRRRNKRVR